MFDSNTSEISSLNVYSPFDQTLIRSVKLVAEKEAFAVLGTAHSRAQKHALSIQERCDILKRLAQLIEAEYESLAQLITLEGGKPLADARIEVGRAIDGIRIAIAALPQVSSGETIAMKLNAASENRTAYTQQEPIGLVFAISAFNHPLNLIIHQAIPAIATGCPVIIKPSLKTPLCCLRFCELVYQAGLEKSLCQSLICNDEITSKIASSSKIGFVSFIGSANVGWQLKANLAPGVRCALEHGGVAPVIVDKSADINSMVPKLIKGGFYHAGQVCVSVQKIYIEHSIFDNVVSALKTAAEKLLTGDPKDPQCQVGPLISPREVERVSQWVDEAVSHGAQLLCGGHTLSENSYAPTIIINPKEDDKISTLEVFGPVISLYRYVDQMDAIARANALDFAFQASVFSQNIHVINSCIQNLNASTVLVNDHTAFRTDWMPFAGRKHSGYGVGGIEYSMRDLLQHKLVVHLNE